ncbi:hypothetical protein [Verrucosispora sp. WMMC514]|uniref:hypothetical protein n=1 Tax=Verrucosispora sp. WMMC514 TaxID=3015156 RepID=UPI00248C9406|nr:hypothetical protein [Verrucosispora sp. WMMC514]WBB94184.1 hypothetical protein O7597_15145 [Verrucosispora sp. WMMC514]
MASSTRVVWNDAAEDWLLHAEQGPVGRDLAVKGERVAAEQRRTCPVSEDGSHGRESGHMRDQIKSELHRDPVGLYVDIGTDATTPDGYPYPVGVELGTRPHTITSHGDYPLRNPKTGRVFGKTVQHPGTQPQPFLRPSLDVLRRE